VKITICQSKQELGRQAADHGARLIRDAIEQRGEANIVIATGPSQLEVLEHLVTAQGIHWPAVTVFHLDEYVGMPITHPASFRLFLWRQFVSVLPLPVGACHYINAEGDPHVEAMRMGEVIRQHPIDVAFVGIGENGHMAFNDPPADFKTKEPYLVVTLDTRCRQQQVGEGHFDTVEDVPARAISMSINQVLASRAIIASVPDERKAEAVRQSVELDVNPMYPSTCLQQHSQAHVYLDLESASLLTQAAPT
jgi:glucosamine-6-phosphate deaminase